LNNQAAAKTARKLMTRFNGHASQRDERLNRKTRKMKEGTMNCHNMVLSTRTSS